MDCKMERKEYCCYLNGVAEGLSKAKEDTLSELEKVWEEIRALPDINPDYPMDHTIHISRYEVQQIIYNHIDKRKELKW